MCGAGMPCRRNDDNMSNKPRSFVGATGMADEADGVNRWREDFDPEIPFAIREYMSVSRSSTPLAWTPRSTAPCSP